jgi:predicted MPP superfamily phosphohydrolase
MNGEQGNEQRESKKSSRRGSISVGRRAFLLTAGGAALGGAAIADAFRFEPRRVLVSRYEVQVPGLPPALDGLRIAQVSDLHLYDGIHAPAQITLDLLQREGPDVVLLTGDICETGSELPALTEFTRAARGRLATFAIYGNWERSARIPDAELAAAYDRAGCTLLVNRAAGVASDGARLTIVGLDDVIKGRVDLAAATSGIGPQDITLWMVHEPGWVDRSPHDGAPPAMILSGHTHGGQIRLPLVPAWVPPGSGRFLEGWYRDTWAPLYVSRGIGTADIRARFRCPPELPVFVLRTAPRGAVASAADRRGQVS